MRNLSWNVFSMTGDLDAYLLYKACEEMEIECKCHGQPKLLQEPVNSVEYIWVQDEM